MRNEVKAVKKVVKLAKKKAKIVPFEIPYLSAKQLQELLVQKYACASGRDEFKGMTLSLAFKNISNLYHMKWLLRKMVGHRWTPKSERPDSYKQWGGIKRFQSASSAAYKAYDSFRKNHPNAKWEKANKLEVAAFKQYYTIAPRRK